MRTIFLAGALALGLSGPALAQRAVIVIRHAEKVSTSDERLSDAGHARAQRLAAMLKDAGSRRSTRPTRSGRATR
jgi:hypothetical protein